ncbi:MULTISPECIES: arsenic resistance protein [Paenibacillus]|uniref:Arsenic resistance protein n=1 Tax=Paenibacillus tianjinensis TaxID=2810347 RepID=A0ABX7LHA9_9BACL|nr:MULTISPECIES: arsenic resistance protein [Paenibacillus]MDF9839631.1 ACR3 family arsenite transporter [Paenibacillus sp. PastF-2]MDF9846212.1 ACR3 family arsenite transporter [Paenibacillus sp. PastM-2]MDF9852784.1 ACR3 family arsenite transporter [Paenibacillus sp. PastF-1]MDH6477486.1 ACR3 family arsenite transporter [Paenibacillus sp. PastH-2]QSF47483.1 arsenic resistance protein [Paenibacillus tianjinensis]
MITREKLEHQQIWLYVIALIIGGVLGLVSPKVGSSLHITISPILAILLYGMFAQIPFLQLRESFSNRRFIGALLASNFVIAPIVVWLLTQIFPQSSPILVGVYLVLLTPCIDYVIVFTQLGRGNERLILAATPILFVVQMILLPVYLWLFMGEETARIVKVGPFVEAFFFLIVIPLLLAIITQLWAKGKARGKTILNATAWLPVPFMALALIIVVASQIGKVYNDFDVIVYVIPVYILFLILMPFLSRMVAALFRLDVGAGRALIFSSGTRNSLVVLPLALSLPDEWATIASAVIVTQTIVELVGELIYIRIVPSFVLRDVQHKNTRKQQH